MHVGDGNVCVVDLALRNGIVKHKSHT